MKKIKKQRRIIASIGFVLVCFYLLAVVACTKGANRIEVRIEVENPHAIDFDRYDNVFYKDLELEWPAKDFSPGEDLNDFFLRELSTIIDKKIEPISGAESGIPADSLLITGKLALEIKERSKIKEVKDETGKPKNTFVNIQHWSMTMAIEMKDGDAGKDIFKQEYTEKLSDVDSSETTTKYNFEKIFFKMTNRFVMRVKKTKRMQRRYLLH